MRTASISLTGALLLVLLAVQPRAALSQQPERVPPPAGTAPEIAFPQLLKSGLAPGRYQLRCVVRAIQGPSCPPCPPRVSCSPCPPTVIFRLGPTAPGQAADSSLSVEAVGSFADARSLRTGLAYLITLQVGSSGPPYRSEIVGTTPLSAPLAR